jgi:hypothetical protein
MEIQHIKTYMCNKNSPKKEESRDQCLCEKNVLKQINFLPQEIKDKLTLN